MDLTKGFRFGNNKAASVEGSGHPGVISYIADSPSDGALLTCGRSLVSLARNA